MLANSTGTLYTGVHDQDQGGGGREGLKSYGGGYDVQLQHEACSSSVLILGSPSERGRRFQDRRSDRLKTPSEARP